jgi:hypothetical protein
LRTLNGLPSETASCDSINIGMGGNEMMGNVTIMPQEAGHEKILVNPFNLMGAAFRLIIHF